MANREMRLELKLAFYVSDVIPLLLHGVEYWNITTKVINQLNQFQREAIIKIAGRTHRDRITNLEIYEWLHKRGFSIYPMELIMAERKIKYFSMVVRTGLNCEDLASRIYWSDVPRKCNTWADFEYEHVKNMRKAIEYLHITEQQANEEFADQKKWDKVVSLQKKGVGYTTWMQKRQVLQEIKYRRIARRQTVEEEIENEEVYVRRGLP